MCKRSKFGYDWQMCDVRGRVSLTALLGQRWGRCAKMVSFICIATYLIHTRWSNAVLTSNHLDDMKFLWAQQFAAVAPHLPWWSHRWPSMVAALACCSHRCCAGRQHFKIKQAEKEIFKQNAVCANRKKMRWNLCSSNSLSFTSSAWFLSNWNFV